MGDSKCIYKNKLDKVCWQYDMSYWIFKLYLQKQSRIKYYVIKNFVMQKNPKYDGYQRGLASMIYKFVDKKTSNTKKETAINSDTVFENKQLAK